MSARVVLAVAAVLAAGLARADNKNVPSQHDGARETVQSSGGGGSEWTKASSSDSRSYASDSSSDSHAVARSSSGSHSSSAQRHAGAQSRGGSSQGSRPPQTGAQARHPRPGTGTGHFDNHGHGGYGYGGSYYGGYGRYGYYPYGYYPYYGYGYGYSPFYFSAYYGYGPSYYGGGYGNYRESGSVRILVDPPKARVYVDGYYAGIVDDFDGAFQRLNVPPGRHEITLKLEGYRTQHFKVYVPVDNTIKVHYDMVRGTGEATSEEFAGIPTDYARAEDMNDADRRRSDEDRYDDRYEGERSRDDGRDQGDTGSVRLQVTPQDASVYVDGEFRGSGRQSTNLRLRPGRHRIEIVRPGYRTVEREVEVEPGRSTEVEFELEKL